ncbi:hypothetical protein BO94DRAFT_530810 [Aspergillus sclerotioniger CBS 115572]|uniref:Uncharacterized protein n=1 Tax=Aspergillus sclerotioniger CBS 115572 TaxID=1450535 RepID=A0A317X8I7_9EURO|nr:hypothetical protein BO94DRAFT_530810 [Aspergillus sclerotioniger CBS 115572]PWY94916.1 hypothetical protein BO94DRAFT_530810 [Aspergillus sclerotioniger CBS 115572]
MNPLGFPNGVNPNCMRPDHDPWGRSTPQSQNDPSLSVSKPVIFPSKDLHQASVSLNQLTTVEVVTTGRGKQLTIPEQLCLVNLCAASMCDEHANAHPKSFWIKIANKLELRTGRRYSWQSCRRRMQTYVTKWHAYWSAYDDGRTCPNIDIADEVFEELNTWLERLNEQKRHSGLPLTVEHYAPQASAAVVARVEPPKIPEPLRTLPEQGLVQQSTKIDRVWVWLRSLPHSEEMERMVAWAGEATNPVINPIDEALLLLKRRRLRLSQKMKPGEQQPEVAAGEKPIPAQVILPQPSLALPDPSAGNKRPREQEDPVAERPARRLRVDPGSHPSGSPPAEEHVDNAHLKRKLVETYFESTFGKLIDRLSARFRSQGAKQQDSPGSCEAIMRDLFKDVGVAVAKALIRMDEPTNQEQIMH